MGEIENAHAGERLAGLPIGLGRGLRQMAVTVCLFRFLARARQLDDLARLFLQRCPGLAFRPRLVFARGHVTSSLDYFFFSLLCGLRLPMRPALAAGGRIDHRVDERRLARVHRGVHRALEFVGARGIDADAAEGLHHLVVTGALDEHGRRRIGADRVDVGAAVDAVIVEDDDADRQLVAADRLDLHS